jgi:hypothetical protein
MADSMLHGIKGYFDSYRPQQQVVEADSSLNPLPHTQPVKLERKLKSHRHSSVSR